MSVHIVHVYGGLGNQMFQFVFYLYLKSKGCNSEINCDYFKFNEKHEKHAQEYLLPEIFPNITISSYSDFVTKVMYDESFKWNIFRILRKIVHRKRKVSETFELINRGNIDKIRLSAVNHYKDYWNDIKFITPVEDEIRKYFLFDISNLKDKNEDYLRRVTAVNSVSVHIRRGDYLKLHAHYGGICTNEYYNDAFQIMSDRVENPVFFFFSDDVQWCKKTFNRLNNSHFIDWNTGKDSYLDMMLMSNCKHNIIANSTFSWWGAFLNQNVDKIVVLPKKLTQSQTTDKMLFDGCIQL